MTLPEVAHYVGRSTQLLRAYFSQGLLSRFEPQNVIVRGQSRWGTRQVQRLFTLQEANVLKEFFERDNGTGALPLGTMTAAKARAKRRKMMKEYHGR